MNIDKALARIEEMVKAAQRGGVQELRPEEVAQNRAADEAQDALDGPALALLVVQLGKARQAQRAWEEFFDQTHWGRRTGTAFNRKYQELKEAWCELQDAADNALLAFAETLGCGLRREGGEG